MRHHSKSLQYAILFIVINIITRTNIYNHMSKPNSESGSATRSDGNSNATITTASSSSLSSKRNKANWGNNRITIPIVIEIFKGANSELQVKVFIVDPSQASKYDEAYKVLLTYPGA